MLTDKIQVIMEGICSQGTGPFDTVFFQKHILVMAGIADQLAISLHADREIVALTAFLHDISAIEEYDSVSRHHILGGERAEEILAGYGYPKEKIQAVKQCILTHSAPLAMGQGTLEEVCISNADAASQIMMPGYWLHYAFGARCLGYEKGLKWYMEKIHNHFGTMIGEARDIVRETYETSLRLFEKETQGF